MIAGDYTTKYLGDHWAIFLGRVHWDPEFLWIDHIPKGWNVVEMAGAKMTRSMVLCPTNSCLPISKWFQMLSWACQSLATQQRSLTPTCPYHPIFIYIIYIIYSITYPYHRISSIIIPYLRLNRTWNIVTWTAWSPGGSQLTASHWSSWRFHHQSQNWVRLEPKKITSNLPKKISSTVMYI